MRALELADYPVREIRFGRGLNYGSGILEVDEEELTALAEEDERILAAGFAIVRPGEKARVTGIRDVVEPRVKIDEPGQVFPGVLGPVISVGEGRTHRLSGMAVVTSVEYEGTVRTGTTAQRSAILDMWGPGAETTHFSSIVNLVLTLKLVPGLPEYEAHKAIQQAEYRVACRLAETTGGLEPQNVEAYDQGSTIEPGLPRTVLIIGCLTEAGYRPSNVSYYGLPILESLSTIISPNEMAD
jgi:glycine reductase complex component B subunit alpha and beta